MTAACRIALTLFIIFLGAISGFCIGGEICVFVFKVRGLTWNHSNVIAPAVAGLPGIVIGVLVNSAAAKRLFRRQDSGLPPKR
jgi:hypothetical protein